MTTPAPVAARKFMVHPGERWVGFFVLCAILALVFFSLKNIFSLFEAPVTFYFHLDDASLVSPGQAVTLQGVNAGVVQKVDYLTPGDPRMAELSAQEREAGLVIRVELTIKEDFAPLIKKDALLVVAKGLPPMLPTTLHLSPGRRAESLADGSRIQIELGEGLIGEVLNVVKEKAGPAIVTMDHAVNTLVNDTLPRLHELVDTLNRDLLPPTAGILAQVDETTLPAFNKVADEVMQSSASILTQVADTTLPAVNERLPQMLDHAAALTATLAKNTDRLERMLINLERTVAFAPEAAEQGVEALESGNQLLAGLKSTWPVSSMIDPDPRPRVTLRYLYRPSAYNDLAPLPVEAKRKTATTEGAEGKSGE